MAIAENTWKEKANGNVIETLNKLGIHIVLEEGASLKNCIVFQHGTIESGAEITNAILDKYVTATRGVKLSGGERRPLIIEKNTVL